MGCLNMRVTGENGIDICFRPEGGDILAKKQASAVLLLLVMAVVSTFVPTVCCGEPICYDSVDAFDYVVQDGDGSDASDAMAASVDGESISKAASEIVVRITAGWGNCLSSVDVSDGGYTVGDFWDALGIVAVDPEYYWAASQFGFGYIDSNGNSSPQRTERLTSISLYYVVPTNTVPDVINATEAKVSEALTWIPSNATRFQIVQALHDYLVRNCVYDRSAVNEAVSPSRTAYGALANGKAVCQGYSLAYKLLLRRAGVPAVYVGSDSMQHAWNMVQMENNAWYHVDVTWDDPILHTSTYPEGNDGGYFRDVSHELFLRCDSTMRDELNHYGWAAAYTSPYTDYGNREYPEYKGPAYPVPGMYRAAGETRYATMAALLPKAPWKAERTVVLASGSNYPDALAAASLAGAYDAPIVLTEPNSLSVDAADMIEQLSPNVIYVVGGEAAVSKSAVDTAAYYAADGCKVFRIAGDTRLETSLAIAKRVRQKSTASDTLIVATGFNYADALSVSPFAFAYKSPIFLCGSNGLSADAISYISGAGFKRAILVGGTAAVPDRVKQQLTSAGISSGSITRLAGATRYETSAKIMSYAVNAGMNVSTVYLATGKNFPDALAAGPVAGKLRAPLLLVDPGIEYAHTVLANYCGSVNVATVVGGTSAVSAIDALSLARTLGLDLY